jgi:excisionase family DNA binding protein
VKLFRVFRVITGFRLRTPGFQHLNPSSAATLRGQPDEDDPVQDTQANVTGRKVIGAPKARRIPEACAALGISRSTIYALAAEGKIRLVHIGRRTVVPETEIDRLATKRRQIYLFRVDTKHRIVFAAQTFLIP